MVGLGRLGLSYILRAGGTGYFRRRAGGAASRGGSPGACRGGAGIRTYPAYAIYPGAGEDRADVQAALRGLKAVAK